MNKWLWTTQAWKSNLCSSATGPKYHMLACVALWRGVFFLLFIALVHTSFQETLCLLLLFIEGLWNLLGSAQFTFSFSTIYQSCLHFVSVFCWVFPFHVSLFTCHHCFTVKSLKQRSQNDTLYILWSTLLNLYHRWFVFHWGHPSWKLYCEAPSSGNLMFKLVEIRRI